MLFNLPVVGLGFGFLGPSQSIIIHSFSKPLSAYSVPGALLGVGDASVGKMDMNPCHGDAHIPVGGDRQ